ncbi:MAG: hypothetical protein KAW42_05825 [Candidatus Atribacteria bacterium]|nr:hypothetical protein [Candidatus Atribacteria bacterium]
MANVSIEETYDLIAERKRDLSTNYRSILVTEIGTTNIIDLQQVFKNKKTIYIYRLFKKNKRYLTNKPIAVKIYQDEGLFFTENENLNVCGTGETSQEALADLYLHILHFYNYYREINEEQLTENAIKLKKLYHDLLIEEK